jgi:tetratricopeptide (TPR) repeat protein
MKRTERHQLKANPVAVSLAQFAEAVRRRKRRLLVGGVLGLLIAGSAGGYLAWRWTREARATALLAQAIAVASAPVVPPGPPPADAKSGTPPTLTPPGAFESEQARLEAALARYLAAADAYPTTAAGVAARYHAAAALVALGRPRDAEAHYQRVIELAGRNIYGLMARLGLAEARLRAGRAAEAAALLRELANEQHPTLPLDAVLIQLGRAYLAAGQRAEAEQTFSRLVGEFPQSLYAGEARNELDRLKHSSGA